ncbi:DUF4383 domain-containing protein [Streptomyces sp. NPDC056600]|uniref:DUF4383 domain-containing protein n=1 Tax=Streptomyces sp. NPDC056600 TaxID=3345874 RepID=UPI00368EB927
MTTNEAHPAGARAPVQRAAQAVGLVFVLVGLLGFIPGITTHYGDMEFASHESGAKLLGVFQVSVLHNLLHLLLGILGLALARTVPAARAYLIGGGLLYLALWIYGLAIDRHSDANFVPLNTADNWLHLILGLGMIVLALALTRGRGAGPTGTRRAGGAGGDGGPRPAA